MALDWFTGFDHYATADLTLGVTARFTSSSLARVQSSTVRTGPNAMDFTSSAGTIYKSGLPGNATRILGFAFRANSFVTTGIAFATLGNGSPLNGGGGAIHTALCLNTSGSLQAYRGRPLGTGDASALGSSLGAASSNTLNTNTWYFIELVVTVSDTVGSVQVYVNGSATPWLNLTNVDTKDGATTTIDTLGFAAVGTGSTFYDDCYCVSGSGGARTTRLGDVRARAVVASAGDGAVAQFTPSSGADNGAMVDESAPNGDTDYNESASVGNIDTYAFATLGATGQIFGLQVHNACRKTDASTGEAQAVARIGTTNYLGTQVALGTSYGYLTHLWEQSPATAADWTGSEADGAEFGIKHAA